MNEKEKRDIGLLYDANYDQSLIEEMLYAKDLCFKYNNILPSKVKKRTKLIKKIIGKTKEHITIMAPVWCDYGYNIETGENFYANHNLVILDGAKVTFGDNVFIGPNCAIYTAGHPLEVEQRNKGLEYAYPVSIGNNVWIGGDVTILPGITIGDNSIIGAGSIVTKNIPSNVIACGNPCVIKRELN